jgi:molybdate transport system ATP-binding protein
MDQALEIDVRRELRRFELRLRLALGPETLALVGPSGAGKSSVLRSIAGLMRPDAGRIAQDGELWFDSQLRVDLPPERRRVGLLFQDHALFPHLDVHHNVAYGLRGRPSREERHRRVGELLARFGLAELGRAKPQAISGGERQRAALARAVASEPRVLLLDEPLSALDPGTKSLVASELSRHLGQLALPTILVSHDFGDVVGLADRVAVMEAGAVVQVGSPADLLQAPASSFVAALTGVNYFVGTAVRRSDITEVTSDSGAAFLSTDLATGPVGVVVYPWDVALSVVRPDGSPRNALAGPVSRVAGVGNRIRVTVGSRPAIVAEVIGESIHRLGIAPGAEVVATWKATGTRLVPRQGS